MERILGRNIFGTIINESKNCLKALPTLNSANTAYINVNYFNNNEYSAYGLKTK